MNSGDAANIIGAWNNDEDDDDEDEDEDEDDGNNDSAVTGNVVCCMSVVCNDI